MTGDCYLMASLGEVAYRNPLAIKNMFTDNGDGTSTVRLYWLTTWTSDTADYGPLWVALAEKAYAQMDQEGVLSRYAGHSYEAISGGNPGTALMQLTGRTEAQEGGYYGSDTADLHSSFAAGDYVVLGSKQSWGTGSAINGDGVVNSHAYACLGTDADGKEVLFNPWGINNGSAPGILYLSDAQVANDFQEEAGMARHLDGSDLGLVPSTLS